MFVSPLASPGHSSSFPEEASCCCIMLSSVIASTGVAANTTVVSAKASTGASRKKETPKKKKWQRRRRCVNCTFFILVGSKLYHNEEGCDSRCVKWFPLASSNSVKRIARGIDLTLNLLMESTCQHWNRL